MKASHRKDVIIARLILQQYVFSYCPDCYNSDYLLIQRAAKKMEQDKVQQNAVSESETDSAGDSDTEIGAIYLPQQTTEGTGKNLRHYYKQCKHEREA